MTWYHGSIYDTPLTITYYAKPRNKSAKQTPIRPMLPPTVRAREHAFYHYNLAPTAEILMQGEYKRKLKPPLVK